MISESIVPIFVDRYTTLPGKPKKSFLQRLITTNKYRLASVSGAFAGENERKFRLFKNKHRGDRCFIIGNGPSLNNLDLTKLSGETCFGVNAIYTNFNKMGFYPTYYVLEDNLVAEDRFEEINEYRESTKFIGSHLSYCINTDEKTVWLNTIMDYREYENFPHFSTNAVRRLWVGGTVTYLCLQLAYFMGFEKVYLIGFDHNYVISDHVEVNGTELTSTADDENHFNADYFGKGKRWHDPRVDRMEQAYIKAKKFFELDGRHIYNSTAGGKLEVFERVPYEQLFTEQHLKSK